MKTAFTPGPWLIHAKHRWVVPAEDAFKEPAEALPVCQLRDPDERLTEDETLANARLIAAAPELYEAAAKHLEWIEKEHQRPQYGELTRDAHPLGEQIWSQWWNEQLDLCGETERLCRAALAKARGEQ